MLINIFYLNCTVYCTSPPRIYCSNLGSTPHQRNKLENVQIFALKMCLKQWNLRYQDLLDISQFLTLKNRRLYLNLCTLYKIMHGYFYFLPNVFLPQVNRCSLPLIHAPYALSNTFQSSFVPSTVSIWNNLSHEALKGGSRAQGQGGVTYSCS